MTVLRFAVAAVVVLVGCGAGPSPGDTPPGDVASTPVATPGGAPSTSITALPRPAPPSSLPTPEGSPPTTIPRSAIPQRLEAQVQAAIEDVASRLGLRPEQVGVISIEEVTWRDGSIGCPEPGLAYTQALVEGLRVRLFAAGSVFEYHAGGARPLFYCAAPQEPLTTRSDTEDS